MYEAVWCVDGCHLGHLGGLSGSLDLVGASEVNGEAPWRSLCHFDKGRGMATTWGAVTGLGS